MANGVYLIAIINKIPLRNGNCPITNIIAEMGVAQHIQMRLQKNINPIVNIFDLTENYRDRWTFALSQMTIKLTSL